MSDVIRRLAKQLAEQAEAARNASSALRAVDAVEYRPKDMWVYRDPEDEGYFALGRSGLPKDALYHVGPLEAIKGIASEGAIRPAAAVGKTPNFASDKPGLHDYGKHSAGRSFLTDSSGLSFWLQKLHGRARHQSGNQARTGIIAFEDPRAVPAIRYATHDQDLNLYGSPLPVAKKQKWELGPIAEIDLSSVPERDRVEAWRRHSKDYEDHLRSLGYEQHHFQPPAILQPPVKPGSPVLHYDNLGTPHAEAYAYFINNPTGTRVEVPPELARKIAAMSLFGPLLAPGEEEP